MNNQIYYDTERWIEVGARKTREWREQMVEERCTNCTWPLTRADGTRKMYNIRNKRDGTPTFCGYSFHGSSSWTVFIEPRVVGEIMLYLIWMERKNSPCSACCIFLCCERFSERHELLHWYTSCQGEYSGTIEILKNVQICLQILRSW